MVVKTKAALAIAAILGALAYWFTRKPKATAVPATVVDNSDTSVGPLSYPQGKSAYYDNPNDNPGVLPQTPPVSLPPYPAGGFTQDVPDTSGVPQAWRDAQAARAAAGAVEYGETIPGSGLLF